MSVSSELANGVRKIERLHQRYFAQRTVLPWELPAIMRRHIYTGAMGNVWGNLIAGLFFVYFWEAIGLTRTHWGVMSGIGSLLLGSQLLSALLTQRIGHRKLLWFYTALGERTLRIVGILLAWWLWSRGSPWAGTVLIAFTCLAIFSAGLSIPAWFSWLGDIIPEKTHGGFWGRRSAWVALAVIGVSVPSSLVFQNLDQAAKLHFGLGLFLVATVIGVIDLVIHGTIPEPAMPRPERRPVLGQLLKPLRDHAFRPWLVFNCTWTFSMMIGASLATLSWMDTGPGGLGLKDHFLGGMVVLTAIPLLMSVLTASWSGRLVDRVGIKPVLIGGQAFWSVLPVFWLVARPGWSALIWLGISSLVGGTASAAALTAANKLVTRLPSREDRAMYVAVDACLASAASALGSFVAAAVVAWGEAHQWRWLLFGRSYSAIHLLFLVSMGLRLMTTLVFTRPIRTPDERRAARGSRAATLLLPVATDPPPPDRRNPPVAI